MADDPTKSGKQDRARVNPSQRHEVQHTARKTGSSPHQVREAAAKAGPMRKDVEGSLKGR